MKQRIVSLKNKAGFTLWKASRIMKGETGDFYISDGVKIIIAVVLGALLLTALTTLFNNTIIPKITSAITNLFK